MLPTTGIHPATSLVIRIAPPTKRNPPACKFFKSTPLLSKRYFIHYKEIYKSCNLKANSKNTEYSANDQKQFCWVSIFARKKMLKFPCLLGTSNHDHTSSYTNKIIISSIILLLCIKLGLTLYNLQVVYHAAAYKSTFYHLSRSIERRGRLRPFSACSGPKFQP